MGCVTSTCTFISAIFRGGSRVLEGVQKIMCAYAHHEREARELLSIYTAGVKCQLIGPDLEALEF